MPLMAQLDGILAELEELHLVNAERAPDDCRVRVAELTGQVFGLAEPPSVPLSVAGLMDVVFAAQDAVLVAHGRAAGR